MLDDLVKNNSVDGILSALNVLSVTSNNMFTVSCTSGIVCVIHANLCLIVRNCSCVAFFVGVLFITDIEIGSYHNLKRFQLF